MFRGCLPPLLEALSSGLYCLSAILLFLSGFSDLLIPLLPHVSLALTVPLLQATTQQLPSLSLLPLCPLQRKIHVPASP